MRRPLLRSMFRRPDTASPPSRRANQAAAGRSALSWRRSRSLGSTTRVRGIVPIRESRWSREGVMRLRSWLCWPLSARGSWGGLGWTRAARLPSDPLVRFDAEPTGGRSGPVDVARSEARSGCLRSSWEVAASSLLGPARHPPHVVRRCARLLIRRRDAGGPDRAMLLGHGVLCEISAAR
jgi:hypothetical protein